MRKPTHRWAFRTRMRKGALGWKASRAGVERVHAALVEILGVAKSDPAVAAEGITVFFERVSPAFEGVDDSSGALGNAVRAAIDELTPIFQRAPLATEKRDALLARIWKAHMADEVPWIESIGDRFGELCASEYLASAWADRIAQHVWAEHARTRDSGSYVQGEIAQLSALFAAGRYDDVNLIVDGHRTKIWPYRQWGFRVLVAQQRYDEAIRYAESGTSQTDRGRVARACENLLIALGRHEEAYERFALDSLGYRPTYKAEYLDLAARYPMIEPRRLLGDLCARTPGKEGKWFAAAMSAKLPDIALDLARRSPVDPKTLLRAATKYVASDPGLARDLCLAALRSMAAGNGYELTALDVVQAHDLGLAASRQVQDDPAAYRAAVDAIVAGGDRFVRDSLSDRLG